MSTSSPDLSLAADPPAALRLRELEETVSARLISEWRRSVPAVLIRRAVREASEIARATDFPQLFLPELAAEQVRRVSSSLAEPAAYFQAA